jgi:hypothetical protein
MENKSNDDEEKTKCTTVTNTMMHEKGKVPINKFGMNWCLDIRRESSHATRFGLLEVLIPKYQDISVEPQEFHVGVMLPSN